ncbi:unnamed protein product [Pieris brassicae]|uniref:Endonuclease/exonuclease/phosphatase domain-containing protein n=1 Tax=Pieris brassicae TaxID=7116 RepID=A0A9P0TSB4_PIEBR|nr:unnamed protein product [Pieris brassicae]
MTETWLVSSICTYELCGVLIAVKNTIKSVRMQAWETSCEDIWVLLDIEAPHSNSLDAVVVAGDFNLPYISWSRDENLDTVLPTNYEYPLGYALFARGGGRGGFCLRGGFEEGRGGGERRGGGGGGGGVGGGGVGRGGGGGGGGGVKKEVK